MVREINISHCSDTWLGTLRMKAVVQLSDVERILSRVCQICLFLVPESVALISIFLPWSKIPTGPDPLNKKEP